MIGTVLQLVVYALLPEELRSSRAVIVLAAPIIMILVLLFEFIRNFIAGFGSRRRVLVVGGSSSVRRIMEMMNRIDPDSIIVGAMSAGPSSEDEIFLNNIARLPEVIDEYSVDEVIFSASDIEFHEISSWMSKLGPVVSYRIAGDKSADIIGSDSKKTTGKLYTRKIEFSIDNPGGRRSKRVFDLVFSVLVLMVAPFLRLIGRNRGAIRNAMSVLRGSHSWVSYDRRDTRLAELPKLRPGFMSPVGDRVAAISGSEEVHTINFLYAREYTLWKDIGILLRS